MKVKTMEQSVRCTYCSSVPFRAHVRETSGRVPVFSLSLSLSSIKRSKSELAWSLSLFSRKALGPLELFLCGSFWLGRLRSSLSLVLACVGRNLQLKRSGKREKRKWIPLGNFLSLEKRVAQCR